MKPKKEVKILLENLEEWTFDAEDVGVVANDLSISYWEGKHRWFAGRLFIQIKADAEAQNEEGQTNWKERLTQFGDIVSVKCGKREIFAEWSEVSTEENLFQKGRFWNDGGDDLYQFEICKRKAKWGLR